MSKPIADLWANFLYWEKLDPKYVDEEDILKLMDLALKLSAIRGPKINPHKAKIESRRLVVNTAMDLGIDLPSIENKYNGRKIIGRGLLDIWNEQYAIRHGSTLGTAAAREAIRRNVVTKLSKLD